MLSGVEIQNLERTIATFQRLEKTLHTEAVRFAERAQDMLFESARLNVSLEDHSLRDLAKLGHPYARRFAKDTLHPDYLVHVQSGSLLAGLKKSPVIDSGGQVMAWVYDDVWYSDLLQHGTYRMRPRPYMAETAEQARPVIMSAAAHVLRDVVVSVGVATTGSAG